MSLKPSNNEGFFSYFCERKQNMKVYVMVYQNDRCEWDAEVDVFTTKDEAQRVMREQYQAAFRRRGCINGYVADPMDGSLPAKRYSCRDDMAEICDDYNCIYDQWQIHEKELKGC
jgi:hypothetical protein